MICDGTYATTFSQKAIGCQPMAFLLASVGDTICPTRPYFPQPLDIHHESLPSLHHFTTAPARAWRAARLTTLLLALAGGSFAQEAVRHFPAAAKRATLQVTYPPEILLNGQVARLSPGARIRGANNLLMVPGSLAGQ